MDTSNVAAADTNQLAGVAQRITAASPPALRPPAVKLGAHSPSIASALAERQTVAATGATQLSSLVARLTSAMTGTGASLAATETGNTAQVQATTTEIETQ